MSLTPTEPCIVLLTRIGSCRETWCDSCARVVWTLFLGKRAPSFGGNAVTVPLGLWAADAFHLLIADQLRCWKRGVEVEWWNARCWQAFPAGLINHTLRLPSSYRASSSSKAANRSLTFQTSRRLYFKKQTWTLMQRKQLSNRLFPGFHIFFSGDFVGDLKDDN